MPPQDYIMKVLWLCISLFVVAYFGTSDAVALKRNGLSENAPLQQLNIQDGIQDGLARELRALPAESQNHENARAVQQKEISPEVGYNKAAMLFVKRYVDAFHKHSHKEYHDMRKKSIYGPGMYPFYGLYGKRVTEDPRYGYNPEVLDMIRGLIERTEAAAIRNRKLEELAKEIESKTIESETFADTHDKETNGNAEKNSEGSQELDQVVHPQLAINEDKAAKVTAQVEDADEEALEAMSGPEESQDH